MPGELPTPAALPPVQVIGGFSPLMEEDGSTEQNSPSPERPAAMLKFHPKRWMFLAGLIVPMLGHLVLGDGIDGVKLNGGRANVRIAKAKMEGAGWSLLPLSLGPLPDGHGGKTYIREVVPGRYYCSAWENCPKGEPGLIEIDSKGYAKWLRSLVDQGHLPAPSRLVLQRLRAKYRDDGSTFRAMARTQPIRGDDSDMCDAAVRCIEAEIERLYGGRDDASGGAVLDVDDHDDPAPLTPATPPAAEPSAASSVTPDASRKSKGA